MSGESSILKSYTTHTLSMTIKVKFLKRSFDSEYLSFSFGHGDRSPSPVRTWVGPTGDLGVRRETESL